MKKIILLGIGILLIPLLYAWTEGEQYTQSDIDAMNMSIQDYKCQFEPTTSHNMRLEFSVSCLTLKPIESVRYDYKVIRVKRNVLELEFYSINRCVRQLNLSECRNIIYNAWVLRGRIFREAIVEQCTQFQGLEQNLDYSLDIQTDDGDLN